MRFSRLYAVLMVCLGSCLGIAQSLKPNLVITKSQKFRKTLVSLSNNDHSGKTAALIIKGNNIVVDFGGSTMAGTSPNTRPDERAGTAILVEGKNITLKNLNARGYKIGIFARNVSGLKIVNCDLSYNWKQNLKSTPEAENVEDWMSYHQNEKDEWLRFGAAIYLTGCSNFEVKGCTVTGGQCALMMTKSNYGLVWNNDFSFNSAVGIGMYRSSNNRIMHNRIDWCVRGYSHGVYNRGQDSTGILIYEQSNKNIFAYNSATHGGDGFFLWAGQQTMDSGKGGCNDNILYGNDFSHSPANAIEATFSRNAFVNNFLVDNWHGIWGGYSFDTVIRGNVFGANGEAIAIEHGQNNEIVHNLFYGDRVGVYLWANKRAPDPNWGYPKYRDTRNTGSDVSANRFLRLFETGIELGLSDFVQVSENHFDGDYRYLNFRDEQERVSIVDNRFSHDPKLNQRAGVTIGGNHHGSKMSSGKTALNVGVTRGGAALFQTKENPYELVRDSLVRELWSQWNPWPDKEVLPALLRDSLSSEETKSAREDILSFAPKPMQGGINPFLNPQSALRGRRYMIVDEWGPYDFKRPLLHRVAPFEKPNPNTGRIEQKFQILGPHGSWKVKRLKGVTLSRDSGSLPSEVIASIDPKSNEVLIELIYIGDASVDSWGRATPKGKPFGFGFRQFRVPILWDVKFFEWNDSNDPRTKPNEFSQLLAGKPKKSETVTDIRYAGNIPGLSPDRFAATGLGKFTIEEGWYEIECTTDDGLRLWLDEKIILNEWKWQGPTTYKQRVKLGGNHQLRFEYFEIDGYSTLQIKIKKISA